MHNYNYNYNYNSKIKIELDKLCPEWVPSNPDWLPECLDNELFDMPFDYTEFNVALNSRNNKSSPGMDGINYEIIKNLPIKFHLILLDIFNEMYKNSDYPSSWKNIFIHFVQKAKGDSMRPLALTSCICKLFELIVSNRMRWWITNNQSGFRKGHSCADNLATFSLNLEEAFMDDEQVLSIFLDIKGLLIMYIVIF